MSSYYIDMVGKVFGKLKVKEYSYSTRKMGAYWLCKCECGNEKIIPGKCLRSGSTKSCGCLQKEHARRLGISYTGVSFSEEHKKKLSKAWENRVVSEETKRRMSTAHKGKHVGDKNPAWNPNREQVRLNKVVRCIMYDLIRRTLKIKKTHHTEEILGYTKEDLRKHLESKFLPGMSWKNRSKWHIDHVIPIIFFEKEGIVDPKIINSLSNLQPLWAIDNIRKHDRYTKPLAHTINLL